MQFDMWAVGQAVIPKYLSGQAWFMYSKSSD